MSFSDVIHLFSKIFLVNSSTIFFSSLLLLSFLVKYSRSMYLLLLHLPPLRFLPVCAGTHINFKFSSFSASMFKYLFSIEVTYHVVRIAQSITFCRAYCEPNLRVKVQLC
jgi:hypothetical protein